MDGNLHAVSLFLNTSVKDEDLLQILTYLGSALSERQPTENKRDGSDIWTLQIQTKHEHENRLLPLFPVIYTKPTTPDASQVQEDEQRLTSFAFSKVCGAAVTVSRLCRKSEWWQPGIKTAVSSCKTGVTLNHSGVFATLWWWSTRKTQNFESESKMLRKSGLQKRLFQLLQFSRSTVGYVLYHTWIINQISYNSAWGQMTEEKRVAHLQIYQIK